MAQPVYDVEELLKMNMSLGFPHYPRLKPIAALWQLRGAITHSYFGCVCEPCPFIARYDELREAAIEELVA